MATSNTPKEKFGVNQVVCEIAPRASPPRSPFCIRVQDESLIGRCGKKMTSEGSQDTPLGCHLAQAFLYEQATQLRPGTRIRLESNGGDQMTLYHRDANVSPRLLTVESGAVGGEIPDNLKARS